MKRVEPANHSQIVIPDEASNATLQQQVRTLAAGIGFEGVDLAILATVASEAARGGSGSVTASEIRKGLRRGIEITATGREIAHELFDLKTAMDDVQIDSDSSEGTVVRLTKWLNQPGPRLQRRKQIQKGFRKRLDTRRRRYESLFDFAPDGYLVTDASGVIEEANTAAAALLHAPKSSLCGRALADFTMAEDREALREQLHALQEGDTERIDHWQISFRPRSGPPFPVDITVAAGRRANASLELRWLVRDVSGDKWLEKERARSLVIQAKAEAAQRFEFLAEASARLAMSVDVERSLGSVARLAMPYLGEWCFAVVAAPNGTLQQLEIAYSDPAASSLARELSAYCIFHGFAAAPPEAAAVEDVTPGWRRQIAENAVHAALLERMGALSAMVVPMRIHDRWLGALCFFSKSSGRYRQQDLALGEDLARRCALALENARLYREASEQRDKAEKASRAKDEFLAILSHELRNPLMPVIGWTRVFKKHPAIAAEPELAEGVRAMERNAQTLARLVDDCLDLARISEGRIQLERKPVDLAQVVAVSIDAVKVLAAAKDLRLTVEPESPALVVPGDAARLQQVVMNLLVNAVKYTDPGGEISVRCSSCDGEAEIQVRDTGVGIPSAFLEQIFEPFRRGADSMSKHESGLGLGLAIARTIVEMHGGLIWAESAGLDSGSSFHLRLPSDGEAVPERAAEPAAQEFESRAGVRVLLIEDSEDIVFLLRVELEDRGHTVFSAPDGRAGIELARSQRPDLIISDLKMPGLDGFEVIRAIRGDPALRATPAIALTGFGGRSDSDRALAAGFDACLTKPAEISELLVLIQTLTKQAPV
jgi:PAS domain S-box-containing protein